MSKKIVENIKTKPIEENNSPFRIVVQFKENEFKKLDLLITAKDWMHSEVKDYWYKVVKETADSEYIYVHIAHEQYRKRKNNTEETSKKRTYNANYKVFKKTKKIVRNVLFIPTNFIIDKIDKLTGNLLTAKIEELPENVELFILKVSKE